MKTTRNNEFLPVEKSELDLPLSDLCVILKIEAP